MNRAKTWALLAGMLAGLAAGPGCMMFDEYDDECACGWEPGDSRAYPEAAGPQLLPIPDTHAPTSPAVP